MAAEVTKSEDESAASNQSAAIAGGFLYSLTVAFPSWAGAILTLYAVVSNRFSSSKVRQR
jgi:hypothetical protein